MAKRQTQEAQTGAVRQLKVLGGPPGTCPLCCADHAEHEPHDLDSFAYQIQFYQAHQRWPTWSDAMAHCAPEVQRAYREVLVEVLSRRGAPIPADLLEWNR